MRSVAALVVGLGMAVLTSAQAQQGTTVWNGKEGLRLEVRGAAGFPTVDLDGTTLSPGMAFEGTVAWHFIPNLGAYAGWGWSSFTADTSWAGKDVDFEETGYTFGVQFIHPMYDTRLGWMLRAGGVFNHIEVENEKGVITADSKHRLGWQAEGAMVIAVGEHWQVLPGIRYRSYPATVKGAGVNVDTWLNYVSTGVGVAYQF